MLHKRADGFHELRTIFQTVSLADHIDVTFKPSRKTKIELASNVEIPGENLITRAAHLVLERTQTSAHVQFRLEKRIPIGGGLGGGSSNAAAVLLALPAIARKPVALEILFELAMQLGSDVPFFLLGGTAVGLGRGTDLYPLPDGPATPAVLVTPGIHVSTPEAYRDLKRDTSFVPASVAWEAVNDFEPVVFRRHPQLESIRHTLSGLGARPALMSGSGSTLFGLFENRARQDRAVTRLRTKFGREQVHAVTLVTRRQYRALWQRQLRAT